MAMPSLRVAPESRSETDPPPDDAPSVRIVRPAAALQAYVTFFYFVDVGDRLDDFLYPDWANVRFGMGGTWQFDGPGYPHENIDGCALFGPTDRATRLTSAQGRVAGFGLTPLGWERLMGTPADALANAVTRPGELFGEAAATIRADLRALDGDDAAIIARLEALISAWLAAAPPNSPQAIAVDRVLRGRPHDVAEFGEAAELGRKQLVRICHDVFGFGPKRLLRRQRFLDTLGSIRLTDQPSFTTLIDPEYFDQSHFNREFREFMGLCPSAYLAAPRPLMAAATAAQLAAGVALDFKLPPQTGVAPAFVR